MSRIEIKRENVYSHTELSLGINWSQNKVSGQGQVLSQCSGASSSGGVWGVFSRLFGENIQTLSHLNTDVSLALQMQQKRTPQNNAITRNATRNSPPPPDS